MLAQGIRRYYDKPRDRVSVSLWAVLVPSLLYFLYVRNDPGLRTVVLCGVMTILYIRCGLDLVAFAPHGLRSTSWWAGGLLLVAAGSSLLRGAYTLLTPSAGNLLAPTLSEMLTFLGGIVLIIGMTFSYLSLTSQRLEQTLTSTITQLERAKQQIEELSRVLEQRVAERTSQLEAINQQLELEIGEHESSKSELVASRLRLQHLIQRVVTAQEEERRRISRAMHDEVTQDLAAIGMTLTWARNKLSAETVHVRQALDETITLAEAAAEQVRQLAHDLRPPALDTLGLSRMLEGICHMFAEHASVEIQYTEHDLPVLPEPVNVCLYRAVQEGLANAVRHADAKHIGVTLRSTTAGIVLMIKDDGRGFDPAILHGQPADKEIVWGAGLRGMQERFELLGGIVEIHSNPHQGTQLIGYIPLAAVKGVS